MVRVLENELYVLLNCNLDINYVTFVIKTKRVKITIRGIRRHREMY